MEYLKSFNNNAALVKNKKGEELVIVGNGIGFGKHRGDQVDESQIERKFIASDSDAPAIEEFKSIRPQAIEITTKVVNLVERISSIHFTDYQYFVLVDHIDFALKRALDGIDIPDGTVRWGVKHLFKNEYEVAVQVIQLIEHEAKVTLPQSEKIFMTYHLLNAENDGTKLQDTVKITQLIQGIISIVQYEYQIELDKESFNYNRFVGHLHSLMIKQISGEVHAEQELDPMLLSVMEQKYPQAAQTVDRIATYLKEKMHWDLGPDDRVYLILHIWRVTHRQKN